jgi:hypothetical protein
VGFTAGVAVLFGGANGEIVGSTVGSHQFGVDGFRIPGKHSDRTDNWWENVDPGVAWRTTRLEILHTHASQNRLLAIVREAAEVAKPIAEVAAVIAAL